MQSSSTAGRGKTVDELRAGQGVKWGKYPDDVLCAWVADMDLGTAPAVVDELRLAVDMSDFGYHAQIYDDVADLAVERQRTLHGWTVARDRVHLFDDVLQAIEAVLWFSTPEDAGVIIHTPVYPPFHAAAVAGGRRRIAHQTTVIDGRAVVDWSSVDAVVAAEPAALILCNPHNPLGRAFTRVELLEIADFAERADLVVIADEVHAELLHPGVEHIPFASLGPEVAARTVTITSASKSFNLAAMRCAVAVVDHDVSHERFQSLPIHLVGQVNPLGARATAAAWRHGDAWLRETLQLLTRNRDHLCRRVVEELPGVSPTSPEATFLAWLDCRDLELPGSPAKWFLNEARVALNPGEEFGPGGDGHVRLNFATSPEILDAVIDRMVDAVAGRSR